VTGTSDMPARSGSMMQFSRERVRKTYRPLQAVTRIDARRL